MEFYIVLPVLYLAHTVRHVAATKKPAIDSWHMMDHLHPYICVYIFFANIFYFFALPLKMHRFFFLSLMCLH